MSLYKLNTVQFPTLHMVHDSTDSHQGSLLSSDPTSLLSKNASALPPPSKKVKSANEIAQALRLKLCFCLQNSWSN